MGGRVEPKKEDLFLFFFVWVRWFQRLGGVIFTSKPGAPGEYFLDGVATLNGLDILGKGTVHRYTASVSNQGNPSCPPQSYPPRNKGLIRPY